MRKRLCLVAMSAITLLGVGGAMASAKAATAPPPTRVSVNGPQCMHLYAANFGYCWYGLN